MSRVASTRNLCEFTTVSPEYGQRVYLIIITCHGRLRIGDGEKFDDSRTLDLIGFSPELSCGLFGAKFKTYRLDGGWVVREVCLADGPAYWCVVEVGEEYDGEEA